MAWPWHALPCLALACLALPCVGMSCLGLDMPCLALPCLALALALPHSRHFKKVRLLEAWHALPWHVLPWHVVPWHALAWHFVPWHALAWHALPWHFVPWHALPWHGLGIAPQSRHFESEAIGSLTCHCCPALGIAAHSMPTYAHSMPTNVDRIFQTLSNPFFIEISSHNKLPISSL